MKKGVDTSADIAELRKLPANKRCFDCNQAGTTYAIPELGIFLCSICGGIHREFNHRVKGLSTCNFSELEVNKLKTMGNEKALLSWMARHDPRGFPIPDLKDSNKLKDFLRLKYIEKRFYENRDSPAQAQPEPPKIAEKKIEKPPTSGFINLLEDEPANIPIQKIPNDPSLGFTQGTQANTNYFPTNFNSPPQNPSANLFTSSTGQFPQNTQYPPPSTNTSQFTPSNNTSQFFPIGNDMQFISNNTPQFPVNSLLQYPQANPLPQIPIGNNIQQYPPANNPSQFLPSNTTPQFKLSNPAPQFPPSNSSQQFSPSNPSPQYPPANTVQQILPSNPTPQFLQANLIQQYPLSKPPAQYPPSNPSPQYQPSNPSPQFQPSNPSPQYQPSNPVQQFPPSNPVPQYPQANPPPQFSQANPPQFSNISQNNPTPQYANPNSGNFGQNNPTQGTNLFPNPSNPSSLPLPASNIPQSNPQNFPNNPPNIYGQNFNNPQSYQQNYPQNPPPGPSSGQISGYNQNPPNYNYPQGLPVQNFSPPIVAGSKQVFFSKPLDPFEQIIEEEREKKLMAQAKQINLTQAQNLMMQQYTVQSQLYQKNYGVPYPYTFQQWVAVNNPPAPQESRPHSKNPFDTFA